MGESRAGSLSAQRWPETGKSVNGRADFESGNVSLPVHRDPARASLFTSAQVRR